MFITQDQTASSSHASIFIYIGDKEPPSAGARESVSTIARPREEKPRSGGKVSIYFWRPNGNHLFGHSCVSERVSKGEGGSRSRVEREGGAAWNGF